MKTIGIIGGMSLESTLHYIQELRDGVRERLGGLASPKLRIATVNFAEIEALQRSGEWYKAGEILAQEARDLERGGADFILLATNTMHKVADHIQDAISIPFIHLADATADAIEAQKIIKVCLITTRYTMSEDFYIKRLTDRSIKVIVPDNEKECDEINRIIFEELCVNVVKGESRNFYLKSARDLFNRGAQGLILGCTEVDMLLKPEDFDLPVFNTTEIHIQKALDLSIE